MSNHHNLDEEAGPEIPSVTSKVASEQYAASSNGQLLPFDKYPVKVGLCLAWTQFAIGIIVIVVIVAALLMQGLQCVGISCIGVIPYAIMYIVAGALGVNVSKKYRRRSEVIATMVTSIFAAIGALCGQFLLAALAISNPVVSRDFCTGTEVVMALWFILLYLGVLEGVVAIILSVMCGQSCCYASTWHIQRDLRQSSQPTQANSHTPKPIKMHGLSTPMYGV